MLRLLGRGILIGVALTACVASIKTRQATQSPMGLARELQRSLSIVNVAAMRRRGKMPQTPPGAARSVAVGRPAASAAA